MTDILNWPIRANLGLTAKLGTQKNIEIQDQRTLRPEENKEIELGRLKNRKFVYECGGTKPSKIIEAIPDDENINRFHKLMEEGKITKEQYKKVTSKILGIDEND